MLVYSVIKNRANCSVIVMGLEKGAELPLGCPASSMHFLEGGIFFGFAAEIEEMTMFERRWDFSVIYVCL